MISREKAQEYIAKLENQVAQKPNDYGAIEAWTSSAQLAGVSVSETLDVIRRLAVLEMKKGVDREIPEEAKLDLLISAVQSKRIGLASYLIDELKDSKKPQIKAGAFTIEGLLALQENRVPEAIQAWNLALKASTDYKPALYNIAFAALRYGDFAKSKQILGMLDNDWYAQSGLIVALRLSNSERLASEYCEKVLNRHPNHKPSLYNCAILEYQNFQNYTKAKSLIARLTKSQSGGVLEERAFRLVSAMEQEEQKQEAHKLKKKEDEERAKMKQELDPKKAPAGEIKNKEEGKSQPSQPE